MALHPSAADALLPRFMRRRELSAVPTAIPGDVNDAQLLARVRAGDEQAFDQLYAHHQGAIYRYAMHMCGAEAADDVVQETFLAVLKATGRFDAERGTVGGYLFGIARHLILRRLGRRQAWPAEDVETMVTLPSADLSALDLLARQEMVDAVRGAITSLPPAYREAIVLCDLQELDYQTAATLLDCPIGTVRSRLHRARALLAGKLSILRPVNQAS
jgi:RNA polymerase sigma-70 factor (ECF subfamily)